MELALLAGLTFFASIIGTLTGFGTSTVMIPVLVLFMPPLEAIFLVSIIHWFGDLWKVLLFKKGFNKKLFVLFGLTGIVTSYFGALLFLDVESSELLPFLGGFLVLYAIFLLVQPRFKIPAISSVALIGGGLSGFSAGIFGIGGAIRGAFLSAFNLPKAVYLATGGAIGLVVDTSRITTYILGGAGLPKEVWWSLILLVPVSFFGAEVAKAFVDRIPQAHFRALVAVFLLLIGLKLLLAF